MLINIKTHFNFSTQHVSILTETTGGHFSFWIKEKEFRSQTESKWESD